VTPDKRKPANRIDVYLNNDRLTLNEDYFWIPGKLVLMSERPQPPVLPLHTKAWLLLTLQWEELTRDLFPYPDLVVVENWDMGERDVYLFGSPAFDEHVCYEEDL